VKVNTVVSRANVGEDLAPVLAALRPDKWKVFQVLPVYGDRDIGHRRGVRRVPAPP
jgi:radical S-adenosyl methionine domain-containing protein 2